MGSCGDQRLVRPGSRFAEGAAFLPLEIEQAVGEKARLPQGFVQPLRHRAEILADD
jgi:hypothetical protein